MNLPSWRKSLRFWGPDPQADIDDELAHHIEARTTDLIAHGADPASARAAAVRHAKVLERVKQTVLRIDRVHFAAYRRRDWLQSLGADLRLGARQLVHRRLLAFVAMTTLGLGIGATTAIFSVVYAVLIEPLPYADANRLTRIAETFHGGSGSVGPGQYTEWVARNRTFTALGAYVPAAFNLGDGRAERVTGAWVTPAFFQVRYARPLAGRFFTPEEETPGHERVVVLSEALFQRRFGGDKTIIGKTVALSGQQYTIVGVAPAAYASASSSELLWAPLALSAAQKRIFSDHWISVYGKLKPGVTIAAAQSDLERVTHEIAQLHRDDMTDRSIRVQEYRADLVSDARPMLTVLFGAVACALLLACLNVTNLLFARVLSRRNEIAIRAALGASRGRIVRQFVVEGAVLAALGGILAVLVARTVLSLVLHIAPPDVPGLVHARIGAPIMAFLAGVTGLISAVLGLGPAMRGLRSLEPALRSGGRGARTGGARDPLRSALVAIEIALAFVLLVGAGLFMRSARRIADIRPGFDPSNVIAARVSLTPPRYRDPQAIQRAFGDLLDRIRAAPHVTSATASSAAPLQGNSVDVGLTLDGRTYPAGQGPDVHFRTVAPGYFAAMRIPMLIGREFTAADRAGAAHAVVVNATLARQLWPSEQAIGKRIACCGDQEAGIWREVVGVSGDVRQNLADEPLTEIYVPLDQAPAPSWIWFAGSMTLLIRTDGHAPDIATTLARTVGAFDPALPVYDVAAYDAVIRRASAANHFSLQLFSALAALAVILASVGVYGVLAYFVGQRTNEIGVRVALGASEREIVGMVMRQGALLVCCGVAVGICLAVAMSRTVSALLYDVSPSDPATYAMVTLLMGTIAMVACYVPARRAAAVDPLTALRA